MALYSHFAPKDGKHECPSTAGIFFYGSVKGPEDMNFVVFIFSGKAKLDPIKI